MKGAELKSVVKDSGLKNQEITDITGIAERTLYNLYGKENVAQHWIDKLSKAIPDLLKAAKNGNDQAGTEDLIALTHKLLVRIDKAQEFHERHITDLEKNNDAHIDAQRAFIKSNDAFVETSKVMSKIVDMVIAAGALKVDPNKVIDLLSRRT